MKYSKVLRRYAAWGLALGVMVACGTQDNTPPSSYGFPIDTDASAPPAAMQTASAMPAPSAAPTDTSGSGSSGSSGGAATSSGGTSSGGGSCPSSCKSASDCAPCGLPAGSTAKNCCVMGICVMMPSCPVIRDSGRDGS